MPGIPSIQTLDELDPDTATRLVEIARLHSGDGALSGLNLHLANWPRPMEPSVGGEYLLVGGVVVVDQGTLREGVFPGEALLGRKSIPRTYRDGSI